MYRIVIYLVLTLLLSFTLAYSIDKTSTRDKASGNQISADEKKVKTPKSTKVSDSQRPANTRDYNDFVDKNSNGIDDRIEAKRKKTSASAAEKSKKKSQSGQKPESGKTGK